jgi:UDP-N-acetylglucosamine 4-epimerase
MKAAIVEERLRRDPRRWLVTGAAGFIGSHLCERLLGLGQTVVGLDDLSTGHLHNIEDVRQCTGAGDDRFRFVLADVADPDACANACNGIDHVLHQAAVPSVPLSIEKPHLHHRANVDGFFTLLEAARRAGCRSIVHASSSSVYGDHPSLPKREDEVGRVLSPYAATKRCNEIYAEAWVQAYGMHIVGIRYFNVFGPRQDPNGAYAAVIPKWIALFGAGECPEIYGDGETSRDFCPVANVVQLNLLAALHEGELVHRVFNVALGRRTTLNELFRLLRDGMAELGAPCAEIEPRHVDFRAGDIRHSLADIECARAAFGYEPEVDLEDGLRATLRWFSSRSRSQ